MSDTLGDSVVAAKAAEMERIVRDSLEHSIYNPNSDEEYRKFKEKLLLDYYFSFSAPMPTIRGEQIWLSHKEVKVPITEPRFKIFANTLRNLVGSWEPYDPRRINNG